MVRRGGEITDLSVRKRKKLEIVTKPVTSQGKNQRSVKEKKGGHKMPGKLDQRRHRPGLESFNIAQKSILSVEEAAAYLGVSSKTILEEIHRGKIPAVKIGRAWRIHRALLDELTKGLSIEDAADRLGISPEIVLKKIKSGEIAAARVEGEWRINPELLDANKGEV